MDCLKSPSNQNNTEWEKLENQINFRYECKPYFFVLVKRTKTRDFNFHNNALLILYNDINDPRYTNVEGLCTEDKMTELNYRRIHAYIVSEICSLLLSVNLLNNIK